MSRKAGKYVTLNGNILPANAATARKIPASRGYLDIEQWDGFEWSQTGTVLHPLPRKAKRAAKTTKRAKRPAHRIPPKPKKAAKLRLSSAEKARLRQAKNAEKQAERLDKRAKTLRSSGEKLKQETEAAAEKRIAAEKKAAEAKTEAKSTAKKAAAARRAADKARR